MLERQRLKELILKNSYEKREVTLASGKKSNFYFDGKQTTLHAEGAYLVGRLMYEIISSKMPDVEAVGGPTLGADPIVTSIAVASHLSMARPLAAFIIRKEPKKHGTGAWIEGVKNLRGDMPVAIVEDVVTSGGSVMLAIEKALDFGLKVKGVCVIVDRQEGGRESIESKYNIPVYSIFTKEDLLS